MEKKGGKDCCAEVKRKRPGERRDIGRGESCAQILNYVEERGEPARFSRGKGHPEGNKEAGSKDKGGTFIGKFS